jgi:hypothetical protein
MAFHLHTPHKPPATPKPKPVIDNRTAPFEDYWRANEEALTKWYEDPNMDAPPPKCWTERHGPWQPLK